MINHKIIYLFFFVIPCFAQVKKGTSIKRSVQGSAVSKHTKKIKQQNDAGPATNGNEHPDTIKNSNGTFSTFLTKGNVTTITNSNGIITEFVDMGDEYKLFSRNGEYMPLAKDTSTVVIANADGASYLFIDNVDNFTISNLEGTSSYVIKKAVKSKYGDRPPAIANKPGKKRQRH